MEFREGMLGVVIVALALTGALFIGYVSGIETTETEVTKYNYLADVSGLFDYDKSPQYIEFDPSSNYVGYYSSLTGDYWPEDYLDYESSSRVNNYRVNLEPEELSSTDITLSDYSGTNPFDGLSQYVNFSNESLSYSGTTQYQNYPTTVTLSSYIEALELDDDVNAISFKSQGDYSESDEGMEYDAEWVSFSALSMWTVSDVSAHLFLGSEGWFEANGYTAPYTWTITGTTVTYTKYLPCLSVQVDLDTGIATLYWDKDCENVFTTTYVDNVYMTYGGEVGILLVNTIVYDDTATITTMNVEKEYLDPNYGVIMRDE